MRMSLLATSGRAMTGHSSIRLRKKIGDKSEDDLDALVKFMQVPTTSRIFEKVRTNGSSAP